MKSALLSGSSANATMRGLTVFIADIRNCQNKETEKKRIDKEMANIRSKFLADNNLSSYQKKKYVWKMLYIFMLGYEVDFGHMEAINLVGSSKFSEKQVGYIACTLLLTEGSELITLIINAIRNDILSRNEYFQAVALTAVANIGGREFAESLGPDLVKLLCNTTTRNSIKKKCSLALLRIFRKNPDILTPDEWLERQLTLLDEKNMGVQMCAATLLLGIVEHDAKGYEACVPKIVRNLGTCVLGKDYAHEYTYYALPSPWLQTKLLRLLQYFPFPKQQDTREKLVEILKKIITGTELQKNLNKNNAVHGIFFEAIALVTHYGRHTQLLDVAMNALGRYISIKDANLRYLGFETMARLAESPHTGGISHKHQKTVLEALNDSDISIRKRALDLLYNMCDSANSKEIVSQLLQYLMSADYLIREDLVLKIAIMAEKYALDYSWYIDVILQLIQFAGEFVADDVWYRVIQIVTNHDEVQKYATENAFVALTQTQVHEKMVCVAGYLLGEFGHLISDSPEYTAEKQFDLLYSHFNSSSTRTKQLLLSAFAKFLNVHVDLKPRVIDIFDSMSSVVDAELQQRACEYLHMGEDGNMELMRTVFEMMPAFPERVSSVLKIIEKGGGRKTTAEENVAEEVEAGDEETPAPQAEATLLDLLDETPAPTPATSSFGLKDEGVLHDDTMVQIGLKHQYKQHMGRMAIYIGNKTSNVISGVSVRIESPEGLEFQPVNVAESIEPGKQIQMFLQYQCKNLFTELPTMHTVLGQSATLALQLPVTMIRFVEPLNLERDGFFQQWNSLAANEAQQVLSAKDTQTVAGLCQRLKFAVLQGVDPSDINIVAAASVCEGSTCLLRVEMNTQAQMMRLTVRSSQKGLSVSVVADLVGALA